MLRAEAVRSKTEQLTKRKLCELYYVTTYIDTFLSKTPDTVYEQNERRFLDANDITKYVD
ncbi:MAG: hypothetical protein Q9160_007779 [Pyrenula sp. 1 TL-2023]